MTARQPDPQTAASTRQLYEQAAAALRQASDARVILNVDAKLLAEKRKTQYDAAKWASYIFYILGWALTFYGNLSSNGHPVPSAL
jgi:hypothetical protein